MSSSFNKKSGFVLLSALLIVLCLSLMIGAAMIGSQYQLLFSSKRVDIQQAFYAAETGISRAVTELRINPGWTPGQCQLEHPFKNFNNIEDENKVVIGSYCNEISPAPDFNGFPTQWIRSIGRNFDQNVSRVILARVIVENPARFLISSLGDIRVGSGATVDAAMLAQNFYFEVNKTLEEGSPQREIHVNGDIFHMGKLVGIPDEDVKFGEEAELHESAPITFTGVDLTRYRKLAKDLADSKKSLYFDGDKEIDLEHLGQDDDFKPLLIFAEGNVSISGDYDHSLLVVAGGNIIVNGSILPNTADNPPQIGLFAHRDVIIDSNAVGSKGGNLAVEAFIVADGGENTDGVFKADGAKNSLRTLNFKGAISARGEGRTAVDMNAFTVRNYKDNPQLANNRKIPFSPFIVNIIRWQEATVSDRFPPSS